LQKQHKVTGLLIDKIGRAVICELNINFEENRSSLLSLIIRDFTFGQITPDRLCALLKILVQGTSKCAQCILLWLCKEPQMCLMYTSLVSRFS